MSPQNIMLTMVRGDTLSIKVNFPGFENDIDEAWFSCKANVTDNNYVFQKTITNGGITKQSTGVYLVKVDPSSTVSLTPGVYKYDFQYQYGTDISTPVMGDLVIKYGVTEGE